MKPQPQENSSFTDRISIQIDRIEINKKRDKSALKEEDSRHIEVNAIGIGPNIPISLYSKSFISNEFRVNNQEDQVFLDFNNDSKIEFGLLAEQGISQIRIDLTIINTSSSSVTIDLNDLNLKDQVNKFEFRMTDEEEETTEEDLIKDYKRLETLFQTFIGYLIISYINSQVKIG